VRKALKNIFIYDTAHPSHAFDGTTTRLTIIRDKLMGVLLIITNIRCFNYAAKVRAFLLTPNKPKKKTAKNEYS
jgi:hypothetical protein